MADVLDDTPGDTPGGTPPEAEHDATPEARSTLPDPSAPLAPADFYDGQTLRPEVSFGYLMKRALASLLTQTDAALAAHDLTHAQWLPLFRIARGNACTVAALARGQSLDPAAMTRALDRLEAKGLVRRVRSASDRRVVTIELTDAGRAAAELVPDVLAGVLNAHLSGFSRAECEQLVGLLHRVLANGDRLRGADRPRGAARGGA